MASAHPVVSRLEGVSEEAAGGGAALIDEPAGSQRAAEPFEPPAIDAQIGISGPCRGPHSDDPFSDPQTKFQVVDEAEDPRAHLGVEIIVRPLDALRTRQCLDRIAQLPPHDRRFRSDRQRRDASRRICRVAADAIGFRRTISKLPVLRVRHGTQYAVLPCRQRQKRQRATPAGTEPQKREDRPAENRNGRLERRYPVWAGLPVTNPKCRADTRRWWSRGNRMRALSDHPRGAR